MDCYEKIGVLGEGTYGMVMKCRHKETGQIVAIKKFKESEDDAQIRKTAMREVRVLKQLKNDNIVNLLEVFRRKNRLYLIFEHVDRTILEELDKHPHGLNDTRENSFLRKCMWQIVKAIDYLHAHNIIHRDIKPENVLISNSGIIKVCDFGFARSLTGPGAKYTDYVATRWYRSPELLVGDTEYGKPVDIWAIACIFAELLTGQPLFPGDTDVDQLYRIMKCLGPLTKHFADIFAHNPLYMGVKLAEPGRIVNLETRFNNVPAVSLSWLKACLCYDQSQRASTKDLLAHAYFHEDSWAERFELELRQTIATERDKQERLRKRRTSRLSAVSQAGNGAGNLNSIALKQASIAAGNISIPGNWQRSDPTNPSHSLINNGNGALSSVLTNSSCAGNHVVVQASPPALYNFSSVSQNKNNSSYSYKFSKKPMQNLSYAYKPGAMLKPKIQNNQTIEQRSTLSQFPKV